jgi:transcriptional regulator with XRE-family HTH domain
VDERTNPVLLRQEIGRRIRAARKKTGLTLTETAAELEISTTALHRIEMGTGPVNVHLARSMMDLFDDRMDGLLDLVRQSRQRGGHACPAAFGPEHKDKEEWVGQAGRWFEYLCALALTPSESVEWLDRSADRLWSA